MAFKTLASDPNFGRSRKLSINYFEAVQDFIPHQSLCIDTSHLLTVHKGERFKVLENDYLQWVLVEHGGPNCKGGSIESGNGPVCGFVPLACLSQESKDCLKQALTATTDKIEVKHDNLLQMKLAKTEQQLHEALEKNRTLMNKYREDTTKASSSMHNLLQQLTEKSDHLEEARRDAERLNSKLKEEADYSAGLFLRVKALEDKAKSKCFCQGRTKDGNGNDVFTGEELSKEEMEEELRNKPLTPIGELMLSCTLCGQKLKIEDLESHSVACSSGSVSRLPDTPSPTQPGMLVATVTRSRINSDDESVSLRVVCKTTLPDWKRPVFVTERTLDDFMWFRHALEKLHCERVVPPLVIREDLQGNVREIQRFLSRLCVHKVLKNDSFVRSFLSSNPKDLQKIKKKLGKNFPEFLPPRKPFVEVKDTDGLLCRTQIYIAKLIHSLELLMTDLQEQKTVDLSGNLSACFKSLSDCEVNNTYLKTTAKALSGVLADLESRKIISYNEGGLVEDLESILEYVKTAQDLLHRVESAVDTFLYWEEEIKVLEEMKNEGLVTSTNGDSVTHKWADAIAKCKLAKEELERMCRDLSNELSDFDYRKEQEIKQIFIEFAESKHQHFEKVQSKWYGVKILLDTDISTDVRAIKFS